MHFGPNWAPCPPSRLGRWLRKGALAAAQGGRRPPYPIPPGGNIWNFRRPWLARLGATLRLVGGKTRSRRGARAAARLGGDVGGKRAKVGVWAQGRQLPITPLPLLE